MSIEAHWHSVSAFSASPLGERISGSGGAAVVGDVIGPSRCRWREALASPTVCERPLPRLRVRRQAGRLLTSSQGFQQTRVARGQHQLAAGRRLTPIAGKRA
jgi:hypothetical protein